MKLHTALVLRNFAPKKKKLAVIDDQLGRIDGAFFSTSVQTGALLQYHVSGRAGRYLFNDIQTISVPLSLARKDILFLHHTLELCYYFIPIGSCIQGIFKMLQLLYTAKSVHWNNTAKQLFLFKLFVELGIHPENYALSASSMTQLHTVALEKMTTVEITAAAKQALRTWLQYCVVQHPYVEQFKTIHFLNYE